MSHILPAVADIRAMTSSTEGTAVLYQTKVTFYSHLQRLCDVEQACSSNVPGTRAEWRVLYNPLVETRPAHRPVLRLNSSSSCYLGKRIAKIDFM
ncbi:hypothetical protein TNCV_2372751 [Trichonephila clavipes]|nr:hypothetical protein TNCV_2372751 [Trichonephila clavipes]